LKIILLGHQNNYERLNVEDNAPKDFNILATNVLQ